MANETIEIKRPETYARVVGPSQNWGTIIIVGVVALCMIVMAVNLFVYKPNINLATPASTDPISPRVQLGRVLGLAFSLGIGGWFLQQTLRQHPSSEQAHLNSNLQQAINYTQKIEILLKDSSKGHEKQLLRQIHSWWQTIEVMAQALNDLKENDHIIQHDLRQLPTVIANLEHQLAAERNSLLQADLKQMLAQRQNQRQALEQLLTTRRRTEIQIERTIAVLGTIYSQLLTYRSTLHVADYQHLADNVAEEVLNLQDYLEALQEVKGMRLAPA